MGLLEKIAERLEDVHQEKHPTPFCLCKDPLCEWVKTTFGGDHGAKRTDESIGN